MIYWISIALIIISLAIIIAIVVKKFSILARIDVENIAAEKQALVKRKIINDKFKRNLLKYTSRISRMIKPVINLIGKFFVGVYNKLITVKDDYASVAEVGKVDDNVIEKLFAEAKDFTNKEDLTAAENKYIEIIGLDSGNLVAFQELGEIYFEKENLQEAEQTFEHVIKLKKQGKENQNSESNIKDLALAKAHFNLSLVHKALGENDKAMIDIRGALVIEPSSPKYLDKLVDVSMTMKDKTSAWEAYGKLKTANPENNKLDEIKQKIEEL